ncbi:hypothetical protein V3C99_012903 [Haemonchus contortus]
MYYVVFLIPILQALELPLAPYNVKVFCRQGRRYTRRVQTALQCSSSTTSCGYLEFNAPDVTKGVDKIGVYECVDNGILQSSDDDLEENNQKLFSQICGAVPQCSHLNLDKLNPAFVKYIIVQHGIQLEALTSRTVRFCCSLFHHTLQRLVTSEKDRLPSISAPPVHCQSEVCGAEAVGCLLHSTSSADSSQEYDEYHEGKRKSHKHRLGKRQADDYDQGIDAVQLFFDFDESAEDGPSLELATRAPPIVRPTIASTRTPEVKRPSAKVSIAPSNDTTTTRRSPSKDEDYEDLNETEETHCVYRHLNDEMYRYCLLVHQKKDGDRCYYHDGHTICCCFVHPDKETCDPTEIDLVRPPPPSKIPSIRVTPPTDISTTTRTAKKSDSPTTSSTSTTTTTTTSTTTTTPPTTTIRSRSTSRRILTIKPKPASNRCRIIYPKKKVNGSKSRPVLICDCAFSLTKHLTFIVLFFHILSFYLF